MSSLPSGLVGLWSRREILGSIWDADIVAGFHWEHPDQPERVFRTSFFHLNPRPDPTHPESAGYRLYWLQRLICAVCLLSLPNKDCVK